MRRARIALVPALVVVGLIAYLPLTTHAQTRSKFVITARAGGVNAVTGRASMRAHGGSEWQQLTIKEDLETGDAVKTGVDGRVEMLLNPGSYLRVGENSEFELANNSLDNLEVRLIRGTAIVEATGADDTALLINITTPHTRIAIVRRGLYRLNVVPGNNTELIVRKGRAMHEASHTKIKGGNKVVFSAETFSVAKLQKADKKNFDTLEAWSKERAEVVAEANRKVRGRDLSLLMASMNSGWARSFSASNSGGFWYYNSRYRCYTFMPFYMGWGSPYGSGYSQSFYPFYGGGCCGRSYNGGNVGRYPASGNNPTGGTANNNNGSPRPERVSSPPPSNFPAFETRPVPVGAERRIERHSERLPNAP
ncbi:MAG: FecR family protein [Acidobacteriota bacterium]